MRADKGVVPGANRHCFGNNNARAFSTRTRTAQAHDVMRDAIIAAGVQPFAGVAFLAAADSLRKAAVSAALAERIEPEPADGGES